MAEVNLKRPRGLEAKYELFRSVGEPGWPQKYEEIWAIGDVGTAKTTAMIDAILFSLVNYPRSRCVAARSTAVELQGSLIPDIQARLQALFESGFLEYIRDMQIIRAANGSELHLFGLDTADNKLWGQQWFRAFIDQGERVKPKMLDLLHTRMRLQVKHKDTKALGKTYVKLTANWDRGRDWVYRRVEDGATAFDSTGDVVEKLYVSTIANKRLESYILAIHSRTHENLELTDDYFRHLILAGKVGSKAVRGGYNQGNDDNLVFVEYSNENISDLIPALDRSTINIGLDHGVFHPTVAIFKVRDENGRVIPVREYIRRNAPATHNAEVIADIIYELAAKGAERFMVYADPSMWARNAMDADLNSIISIYESVFSGMGVPIYVSPAFGKRKVSNLPAGGSAQGTIEHGITSIKDLLLNKRLIINPRLTPQVDIMLTELTYPDIQADTMTKVDVFDAFRYGITNIRVYHDEEDEEPDEFLSPRPFALQRTKRDTSI